MKKIMYYLSPFVILPIMLLLLTLLESTEILKPIVPYFSFTALFLFAVVIGLLSNAKTKFDYVITVITPISVFFALFISLIFDAGCSGAPQFSLSHALNMEYYRSWLPVALVMMIVTFAFSFEPIRDFMKNKFSSKKSAK